MKFKLFIFVVSILLFIGCMSKFDNKSNNSYVDDLHGSLYNSSHLVVDVGDVIYINPSKWPRGSVDNLIIYLPKSSNENINQKELADLIERFRIKINFNNVYFFQHHSLSPILLYTDDVNFIDEWVSNSGFYAEIE